RTLEHVANTVAGLEKQIDGITKESEELLHRTNQLAENIQDKTESVQFVFTEMKKLGGSVGVVNDSIRHVADNISTQAIKQSTQIDQAVQWGSAAIDLYAKFKKRKQQEEMYKEEL